MASAVYLMCAMTSAGCALLLLRAYLQLRNVRRTGLLLWSSLCFLGLAGANALLFFDLVVFPRVDLAIYRALLAALATMTLVIGLIWEME